uniref:GYF domain-containing protein n=1 Tax=Denticeps clupeoides TaxID=299321 RepID=A0AAY4EWD0_9TELE
KMAETQTLNFGPEWLRALSGGGGGGSGGISTSTIASPPLSPALPKYKLADYRYGREEMLALYVKENKIPVDLHDREFLSILQEDPLPPLALVPFTEEEQRNFSMPVNSAAVLRLTGRGGGPVAITARGRSSSRGRGRGRGDGGFYPRSFDDVEGGFGRGGREMHRSQSWEESYPPPPPPPPPLTSVVRANYEDGGTGLVRKHDFTRSESENWRTSREEQNGEDDDGGWRLAGSRRDGDRWCPPSPDGPRSAGWREHPEQRRRFPFDARGDEERGYRRPRSGSGSLEDERDTLPEWCLEDAEEETGMFDSSGAFHSLKKVPKEPILEEVELDFRPLEECEEHSEKDESETEETKETDAEAKKESERSEGEHISHFLLFILMSADIPVPSPAVQSLQPKPLDVPISVPTAVHFAGIRAPINRPSALPNDVDEDEGLKHFEQEAEKMVAYLQDGVVDDDRISAKGTERPSAALPITHEAALKWFYKDPQGEIQGPFSNQEMTDWFQAGYFTMTLLVKRGCDEVFQPLGEIIKIWGRVPFAPGPAPPPILGDVDQERIKRQQELTALNIYQIQQLQYQYLLSSVWDLPIDSVAPAQTIEQIQHLEKANALKVWNTTFRTSESHSLYREEALRRQKEQEEVQRRHKEEEEERLAQEEAHRRMEEKRREEAEKRQREEFLRKQEERQKQEELEALRKREEEKRLEEEEAAAAAAALVRQQEEQRRRDQEVQRQQELQKQRQQQQEALRRLQQQQQQQQLAQMKLPSTSKWGQQSVSSADMCQSQNALSLSEIQKLEEKRERLAREEHRRQQQELLKAQQQQQQLQAQAKLPGWGSVAKQPAATKSLLEIQREEAQQMKQRKEQQLQSPAQQNRMQNRTVSCFCVWIFRNSVWGVSSTGSHWGSDSTSIWGDTQNSNMGFWDEAVKEAAQPPARKANSQKNKGNANLSNTAGGRANKKVEEEEKLLKLFQGASKSQDGFMQWCEQTLHTLNTANNLDVPTFASFLKEVDSHYEVHDYVKAYLGDTPQAKDFAKQFLERRAKQNANQQKPHQGQLQQDSVWGVTQTVPQAIFQSNHSSFQQQRFETVTSGKKKKKQKMVRADPSLLGFSVNASSERLNMGEIETVEDF